MRLHRGVPVLAAVIALASTAPAAQAFEPDAGGGGGQSSPVLIQHHTSSSPDWLLVGVAAAGGLTVAGAGLGANRRRTPRSATVRTASHT